MGGCVSEDSTSEEPSRTIQSVRELTPQQEAFISNFKMQLYARRSDHLAQISTFEHIENEFYNKYDKTISRDVLYSMFNVN